MKRWFFGFLCGFALAFSIPVISPDAGREAGKLQRKLGIGGPDELTAPVLNRRETDSATSAPLPDRPPPSDNAPPAAPDRLIIPGDAAAPDTASRSNVAPIFPGAVPMPRKRPSHLGRV